jgi:hypothetical protein
MAHRKVIIIYFIFILVVAIVIAMVEAFMYVYTGQYGDIE